MKISIRKFESCDIENKVRWINNSENNQFLHYDLPLEYDKTLAWFEKNKDRTDRYDAVIEADGVPVGLIGLLSIDFKNSKAEYYISMGETCYKGKGVAAQASILLLEYAFRDLNLNRVYLYTETSNVLAQNLFEKVGFVKEGIIKNDLYSKGKFVDRFVYGILKDDFFSGKRNDFRDKIDTPINLIGTLQSNELYIKREDLIPISFGGNKARKAMRFFEEIDKGEYDCVVTYGSSSSNHCRIVSNMACQRGMECHIISPKEASDKTYNSTMMELFGAKIIVVPVEEVSVTIENHLAFLKKNGKNPYFIQGGGHGNIGTAAYVDCYSEIKRYEEESGVKFDYIFHATGTGTTQAGLICGRFISGDKKEIVGISIARRNPRGREVVLESVKDYLKENDVLFHNDEIENATVFCDDFVGEGYGSYGKEICESIERALKEYAIPLDSTYTGKAFAGMVEYVKKNKIENKKILFIHTGGTPLFFDYLNRQENKK